MQHSLSAIQFAWHSRHVSLILFLQMAQFSTATFQLQRATAFHCLTSILLSISIQIQYYMALMNINYHLLFSIFKIGLQTWISSISNDFYKITSSIRLIEQYFRTNYQLSQNFINIKHTAMSYQNIVRDARPIFRGSPTNNPPVQPQIVIKKKVFARKPAFTNLTIQTDKQRKVIEQIKTTPCSPVQREKTSRVQVENVLFSMAQRRERYTENFNKAKQITIELTAKNTRDSFYSPKSQKRSLLGSGSYLLRKPSQKETANNSFNDQQSIEALYNSLYKPSEKTNNIIKRQSKFDQISIDSMRNKGTPTISLNSSMIRKDTSFSNGSESRFVCNGDKPMAIECLYCQNNKKIVDILNQKYAKLQVQLKNKLTTIKDLTDKCEQVKFQNISLCEKLQKHIQSANNQETEFFKIKEDLTNRIDNFKKEILKLNEKVRYIEIENSMLLRFKDEYQLMTREYDLLKCENDQLKKHLMNYVKQKNGNFAKPKNTPQLRYIGKDGFSNNKKNTDVSTSNTINIYYDCEDDNLSLSFSEQSTDQF